MSYRLPLIPSYTTIRSGYLWPTSPRRGACLANTSAELELNLYNGKMGLAWSNEEARQSGEIVHAQMIVVFSSNRAGDVNDEDGRDDGSGGIFDCAL